MPPVSRSARSLTRLLSLLLTAALLLPALPAAWAAPEDVGPDVQTVALELPPMVNPFLVAQADPAAVSTRPANITTSASGAMVMDCETGEVYFEKNADAARPVASMTKLMSLYLVLDALSAGTLTADTPVKISAEAERISNTRAYSGMERFTAGASHPAGTLIGLAAIASGNASTLALAEHLGGGSESVFVERMNTLAAQWGIDAHFADSFGFEDKGNAVSPRAMATIARRLLTDHPEILSYTSQASMTFQGRTYNNTNSLLGNAALPGIDGLKTGMTYGAGYCFTGTATQSGRRLISVVMNTASASARMSETRKLLEYGFACRAWRETTWSASLEALAVTFSTTTGAVVPYAENTFTATVSGVDGVLPCTMTWELNGQAFPLEGAATLANGQLTLDSCTPGEWEDVKLALTVTLPTGESVRREGVVAKATPLSFSGYLGIPSAILYPGAAVTIPCVVRCDQNLSAAIPVAWYLDGQPIPHYRNNSFSLAPDGASRYTFVVTEETAPGVHVLEFRCNPDNLPGLGTAVFSSRLEVLATPF